MAFSREAKFCYVVLLEGDVRLGFADAGSRTHRHAVAEFAHQGLSSMRQRFQPRQTQKPARPLDGVNKAEDVIQDLGAVRLLLELHKLIVDGIQPLAGLPQKLP